MRQEIGRLTTEALERISALNAELDTCSANDNRAEHELEQTLREAAATLIDAKQTLREKLKTECTGIIADISKLQMAMPDITGPTMSELKPPYRPLLQRLESQTQEFRLVAAARAERKNNAMKAIRQVCLQLDLNTPNFDDSLAENDICEVEAQSEAYAARLNDRRAEITQITQELRDMCSFLAEDQPSLPRGLSERDLAGMLNVHKAIKSRYQDRRAEVAHIETQVTQLAELLDVPSQINSAGNAVDRLKAADLRLVELNNLKRKCIGQVVDKARAKIAQSWDELCVDQRHRTSISETFTKEASETVLAALEAERLSLEALTHDIDRQKIVMLLHEYSTLRDEERKLAEASRDPKRLAQRGFSQILKREEATRKLLERKKPPLVQCLLPLLQKWADEHNGESFVVDGEQVCDLVEQERAKLERRSRSSLTRKRPVSSDARLNAAESTLAKRVKPSTSTPMLRVDKPRVPAPPQLHRRAGHQRAALQRPQTSRAPVKQAAAAMFKGAPKPEQAQAETAAASSRKAAMRTTAIRAASRAIQDHASRSQGLVSSRTQHSVAKTQRGLANQVPNPTMRVNNGGPASGNVRRSMPIPQKPSSQQSQGAQTLRRQPIVQSTPVGPQPQRLPLAPQRPSISNRVEGAKPTDWRAQRKADLQENGLSYYDDSTAELSVQQPGSQPGPAAPSTEEESFNFKCFF